MKNEQVEELLLQALEGEIGGIQIYEAALRAVQNKDLRKEWSEYLEQTTHHEQVLLEVFDQLELDPMKETPGRKVVRAIGAALVQAIDSAVMAGPPAAAELVAAECVVSAETKDHMNWSLLSRVAGKGDGKMQKVLKGAVEEVEKEEDEHLYHNSGWARELWLESLGLPAVLPPPEERQHVKTALEAARAKQSRGAAK